MRISNLRIERVEGWSRLVVDIKAKYTHADKLWYAVPSEYERWLSDDVYDAFLISALYPAMYYDEPIEIDGCVSKELYYNIVTQVQDIAQAYRSYLNKIKIVVAGYAQARQDSQFVGTGFSAGVDSFCTFYNHYENELLTENRISAFFFFNVGSHGGGGESAHRVFEARYELLKPFPASIGLPYVKLDSNLFDFYLKHWEYDAGIFCRAAAILTLQRAFNRYYLSSAHSYSEWMRGPFDAENLDLASVAEGFLNPLLCTEKMHICLDGAQYLRSQKLEMIAEKDYSRKFLNVCVQQWREGYSARNCSCCSKCLRTLFALEAMGVLDQYSNVFDVEKYKKISFKYKCELILRAGLDQYATDNVNFARAHGLKLPSRLEAIIVSRLFKSRLLGKMIAIAKGVLGEKKYSAIKKFVCGH